MKNRYIAAAVGAPLFAVALFASTAFAATITSQMDIGATGSDVTTLQSYLAQDSSIYPEGKVTGYFGALTAAAVARFQTAHGLASVGRVGPLTLVALNNAMGGVSTGGNGADIYAPIITVNSAVANGNSATITFQTNEPSTSRVMYGTTWPFLYANAPSVYSTLGASTNGSVVLTNLSQNTKYFYTIESTDSSGNLQYFIGNTFTTTTQ